MQSQYESNYQCLLEKMYRLCIATPSGSLPYQKMAQEFKDRCLAAGVPKVALTDRAIGMITENTSMGAGSAALRLQAINMAIQSPVYFNAPEPKKIAIERALVASLLGTSNVEQFARSVYDNDIPDQDDSLAMQESNGLAEGGQAILASVQDHVAHAQNHLAKAMELAQLCEQGQEDPTKCAQGIAALLQHAGEHLSIIQNNLVYKQQFQQLEQQWKELAQYLKTLQGELQSQNGEVPPQQQLSEEMQLKQAKLQGDMAIKQDKWATDKAIKIDKAGLNNRLAEFKTTTGVQRDNIKTATSIQRDNVKTAASIQQSRAKAAATPRAKT